MPGNETPEVPHEPSTFRCDVSRHGDAVVLAVLDELDLLTVPEFGRTLNAVQTAATGPVVLDLTGVTFLDSSGINAIVRAGRPTQDASRRLRVVAIGPTVLRTIRLAGAHELLVLAPTVDEALAMP